MRFLNIYKDRISGVNNFKHSCGRLDFLKRVTPI